MPRDLPAVQAPIIGASGTQQRRRSNQETPRYQIGTKGKLPSPSWHQENPACGRRCGARTASASRASPLPTTLTLPAGLPSIPSILLSCSLASCRRRVLKAQTSQAFMQVRRARDCCIARKLAHCSHSCLPELQVHPQQQSSSIRARAGLSPPSIQHLLCSQQCRSACSR